ncbi:MAG: WG repeat-containing protein [Lachnospira sp.]
MKTVRLTFVIAMVVVLGLSWYIQISSVSDELIEYNKYVTDGNAAFEKTHFQESYIAYENALKLKKTEEVQDKVLSAYKKRYEETNEYTDFDDYISAYTDAYNMFNKNSKYYEGAISLMLSDSRYDSALKAYNQARKNYVNSDKLAEQYNKIKQSWELIRAGYKEYTEPFNGYYTYYKEIGWCVADVENKKDVIRGYPYVGRVGYDEILFSENMRGKSEFIDTSLVVRGKIKNKVETAGIYNEGFIPVKVNGKYFYTDLDGKNTFGSYKFAGTLYNDCAAVQLNSGEWSLINKEGNQITENKFEDIVLNNWDSCLAGNKKDKVICKKNGNYYVYSADGNKEICSLDCQEIGRITDDNIFAAKKSGKWGFVDIDGKWIINPEYDNAKSFSNGFAAVCMSDSWMIINKSNQIIAKGNFSDIGYVNSDGFVLVKTRDEEGDSDYYDWLRFPYFDLLTGRK